MTEAAPTTQAEQEDAVREALIAFLDDRYWQKPEPPADTADALLAGPIAPLKAQLDRELRWVEFYEKAQADANRLVTYMSRRLRALEAAEAQRDQLAADLRKAAVQISDLAQAKGEAEGRLLASEMAGVVEGWRERALKAEAEKDRLHDAMEDLQGAFHESSDTYAKITAALTPDPNDAGGTAKGDDHGA